MYEQINGYDIIGQLATPKDEMTRAGRVILVDKGEEADYDRWVTAWQGRDDRRWDSSWCHGRYFNDKDEALESFFERCRRKY